MLDLREESDIVENSEKKIEKIRNRKAFRLQGRNVFLTYPKCSLSRTELAGSIKDKVAIKYLLIAQELHEDGSPHLHALVCLDKKLNTTNEKYFDAQGSHGNYQVARDTDDVVKYIKKADTMPYEEGYYASNNPSTVQKRAKQNALLMSKPLHTLVDEGVVHLSQYKHMKESLDAYNLDKIEVPAYIARTCIWIYGATGIGKSRYIRDNHPGNFYSKPMNKWWDGYQGEEVVLIDDFEQSAEGLGHHLKIWGDVYSFTAEVKGGSIRPVYTRLYVTSQYLPRDIWCKGTDESKWDDEMRKAVERRFKIVTIDTDGVSLVDLV